jgi:hypothetical protein
MALRDGLMNCEGIIDVIPLKDEDMRKMVREDASSHKPGQTSTDQDRTVPQALHESRPPVGQNSSRRAWRRDNIFLSYFAATKLNFGLYSRFLDLAPIALFHTVHFSSPFSQRRARDTVRITYPPLEARILRPRRNLPIHRDSKFSKLRS